MSATGLSNAGKEAQGWPREYGAWATGQFKNWIPRSDQAYSTGQAATDWYKNYSQNRANTGIGSIDSARAWGSMIMPGVDTYTANKQGRINQAISDYNQLPGYQTTVGQLNQANQANRALNQEELGYINDTRNYNLQDVGDTYNRGVGYESTANTANVQDLTDRYNSLLKANADTYGGLRSSATSTYDQALKNAELLKPGSQFQVAQTARSYAPMMADAAGKLRRMGLDNTPQALSAMGRVEDARARAMDDAAARGTQAYISAVNPLLQNRQADMEKLGTGELGTQIGLSSDQGTGLRGENVRHAGSLVNLDATRGTAARGVQDTAMNRISNNFAGAYGINQQDAQNAMTGRSLALQDFQNRYGLQGNLSDAELEAINLNKNMADAGWGYNQADLAERNAGAAAVGNVGQNQLQYGITSGNMANQWGNTGSTAYQTAYGYEAPNAGWLTKGLGSLAGGALNMVAPGAGDILTGMIPGGGGSPMNFGSFSKYFPGGGGGGMYNPGQAIRPGTGSWDPNNPYGG